MERIKKSVTPSGVEFSVRNLIGKDQDLLTRAQDDSDSNSLNELLFGALRSLGEKNQSEITKKDVSNLLSNDRKFILVTIREHTLGYKKVFNFNFEWALRKGSKEKEIVPYEVNFTPENFPVKPYYWVAEKIAELQTENPEYLADGHVNLFPIIYSSYTQMLTERKVITGTFPTSGDKYQWSLLDGEMEKKYSKVELVINTMLEMRGIKLPFVSGTDDNGKPKQSLIMFDTSNADIMDLEHLRTEIRQKEGTVDTFLTIQNPDNIRSQRVDLISLPVFFFPSQAL